MRLKTFYKLAIKPLAKPLSFSHQYTSIKNHPLVKNFLGPNQKVRFITTHVNSHVQILILGSPETHALTTGFLDWQNSRLQFSPARLHTGPRRSFDAAIACLQGLQLPPVANILNRLDKMESQLLLVDLLREGQKTQIQEAIYHLYRQQPANIILSIYHIPDNTTPLTRRSKLAPPNLEGVNPETNNTLILSDLIAGGVHQFYSLQFLFKKLPKIKQIIFVSPFLSQYGALALARFLKNKKVKALFIGYGALLNSNPPEMYFSPTPVNEPQRFANPQHVKLMDHIYGKTATTLGVGGDWTAMFLAPELGLDCFKKELAQQKLTIKAIKKRLPSLKRVNELGFSFKELTPASTYFEAIKVSQLPQLQKALKNS